MLRVLAGDRPARLLTDNPAKLEGLRSAGVKAAEDICHETVPTETNYPYIRSKKDKGGHRLPSLATQ